MLPSPQHFMNYHKNLTSLPDKPHLDIEQTRYPTNKSVNTYNLQTQSEITLSTPGSKNVRKTKDLKTGLTVSVRRHDFWISRENLLFA